jgi:radical SAM superfamily enzyme YgiQ (UPF0313 family)
MMTPAFELGPIRPPSEAYSLLIRATRNCSWNRCRFCTIYKGHKFEYRSADEVKRDIDTARAIADEIHTLAAGADYGGDVRAAAADILRRPASDAHYTVALWLYGGGETVFLQDSNSLIMRTADLVDILRYLKTVFPSITRITSYGRSDTAARKSPEDLLAIREAGLTRLHLGLETGYDPLLKLVNKGVTAARHIEGGQKVKAAGITLSEYVILGLGGQEMWREHAAETARTLNLISPDFVRMRTFTVKDNMDIAADIKDGKLTRLSDDGIVAEERLLLENLTCRTRFVSDHITNLLMDIEGELPEERDRLLAVADRYLEMTAAERENFRVGRRVGVYASLDDMGDTERRQAADYYVNKYRGHNGGVDEEILYRLMTRFI